MSNRTNRKYRVKLWSSDGSGITMLLRVCSGVDGYRFEHIEPLKPDADDREKDWYNKYLEPLVKEAK